MARNLYHNRKNKWFDLQIEKKGQQNKNHTHKSFKYYDPHNSDSDKEDEETEAQPTGPSTLSRDSTLSPPIDRFAALAKTQQDEVTETYHLCWEAVTPSPIMRPSQQNLGRCLAKTRPTSLPSKQRGNTRKPPFGQSAYK